MRRSRITALVALFLIMPALGCCARGLDPTLMERQVEPLAAFAADAHAHQADVDRVVTAAAGALELGSSTLSAAVDAVSSAEAGVPEVDRPTFRQAITTLRGAVSRLEATPAERSAVRDAVARVRELFALPVTAPPNRLEDLASLGRRTLEVIAKAKEGGGAGE